MTTEPDPAYWCPECHPEIDPLTVIVIECRCATHSLSVAGVDDHLYTAPEETLYAGSSCESEGHTNRLMNNLLYRSTE